MNPQKVNGAAPAATGNDALFSTRSIHIVPPSGEFLKRAALLTSRGIPVAPVDPGQRRCTLFGWPELATTDQNQINLWAAQMPNANTAAVCLTGGTCVLDSDAPGLVSRIEQECGQKVPPTFVVRSGGKGLPHVYFRHTDRSTALGNRKAEKLFDFQADRKYVVGPGSVRDDAGSYDILKDAPIAPIPDWLCDWLEKNSDKPKATAGTAGNPVHPDFDFYGFLNHYDITVTGERGNWQITNPCPVSGETHGGNHNTGFYYDGQTLGWHCFDTDCPGNTMTVGQVIKHLNKPDGMRIVKPYAGPIWSETKLAFAAPKVDGGDDDYILGPLPEQMGDPVPEGQFPLGEVSLIGGTSGAGKSTVLYDVAEGQRRGGVWFGRATYGRPCLIILRDRGDRDVRLTFRRLGLDQNAVDYHVLKGADRSRPVGEVLGKILDEREPERRPQLVVIEGLDLGVDGTAVKMEDVVPVMDALQTVARHFHVAIVGTVGSPKMKVGEDFVNERERLFGSGAWGRMAATVWILTAIGKEAERVKLVLLGRHSRRQEVILEWQKGKLVEVAKDQLEREGDKTMLDWVCEQEKFTKAEFKRAIKASGSTVNKKLEGLKNSGLVAERYNKGSVYYEVKRAEVGVQA